MPLFLGGAEWATGDSNGLAQILISGLFWVPGLFLLWNVVRNVQDWDAEA